MQTLLIITFIFWIAYMFLIKILWAMMQDEGLFSLFGWNKLRDKLYASKKPFYRLLENALGGCEQCTSFWWALPWTGAYYTFCKISGYWVTDGLQYPGIIIVNIFWIIIFMAISAGIGHWYLIRKNGV